MTFLAQTTQASGMRTWDAQQWGVFLGALATFLTVLGAVFTKIILSIADLRRTTTANSMALVPLMDANKADPSTPSVDPAVENAVRSSADKGT